METYISQVIYLPFAWDTVDTVVCRGQTLDINQNQALYSLLGTRWGGDGIHTFVLPDLRPFNEAGPDFGKHVRREWHADELVPHMVIAGLYPSRA